MSYVYDPQRGYLPITVRVVPQKGVVFAPSMPAGVPGRPMTPVGMRPVSPVLQGRSISPVSQMRPRSPVLQMRPTSPFPQGRPLSPISQMRPVSPISQAPRLTMPMQPPQYVQQVQYNAFPVMAAVPFAPRAPPQYGPTRDPNDPSLVHVGVPSHLSGRIPPKIKEPNFSKRLTKELTEPAVTNPNDIRSFITNQPCHDVQSDDWWFW